MKQSRRQRLRRFQEEIGYIFTNPSLLEQALTHSSFANECKTTTAFNERLEFLGDAVVDLIVSEVLYKKFSDQPEGILTKYRSKIVCEPSFARASRSLQLHEILLLGKGEEMTGGRQRDSLLADTFEAFCGAMYLDSGYKSTSRFLLDRFEEKALQGLSGHRMFTDYKTSLQELYHQRTTSKIKYRVRKESGPDHDKTFYIDAYSQNQKLGSGIGKSKKEAEQQAAKCALEKINEE